MRMLLFNLIVNALLTALLVIGTSRALAAGLEETHLVLAITFGLAVIVCNAAFVLVLSPRRRA
ncbi:MAG: hypothetical protein GXX94_06315 [Chloroflexi bacterium]|nr:hypothetical protein [Chloroflexota bacterium]